MPDRVGDVHGGGAAGRHDHLLNVTDRDHVYGAVGSVHDLSNGAGRAAGNVVERTWEVARWCACGDHVGEVVRRATCDEDSDGGLLASGRACEGLGDDERSGERLVGVADVDRASPVGSDRHTLRRPFAHDRHRRIGTTRRFRFAVQTVPSGISV